MSGRLYNSTYVAMVTNQCLGRISETGLPDRHLYHFQNGLEDHIEDGRIKSDDDPLHKFGELLSSIPDFTRLNCVQQVSISDRLV